MLSSGTCLPSGSTPTFEPDVSIGLPGDQHGRVRRRRLDASGARSSSSSGSRCGRRASGLRSHRTWPVERLNSSPARGGSLKATCTGSCLRRGDPGERERGLGEREAVGRERRRDGDGLSLVWVAARAGLCGPSVARLASTISTSRATRTASAERAKGRLRRRRRRAASARRRRLWPGVRKGEELIPGEDCAARRRCQLRAARG